MPEESLQGETEAETEGNNGKGKVGQVTVRARAEESQASAQEGFSVKWRVDALLTALSAEENRVCWRQRHPPFVCSQAVTQLVGSSGDSSCSRNSCCFPGNNSMLSLSSQGSTPFVHGETYGDFLGVFAKSLCADTFRGA